MKKCLFIFMILASATMVFAGGAKEEPIVKDIPLPTIQESKTLLKNGIVEFDEAIKVANYSEITAEGYVVYVGNEPFTEIALKDDNGKFFDIVNGKNLKLDTTKLKLPKEIEGMTQVNLGDYQNYRIAITGIYIEETNQLIVKSWEVKD